MTGPSGRQVLNWFGLIVLLAIVVPFVVYAIPGLVGAEGSYVVLSGSMEPSISTGDVVIVTDVEPIAVEEGDVITYLRSGSETPTTHRVVEITQRDGELAFVTRGDANDQPDASPVPASQLIGLVVFTIPYVGYVIEFVNTPTGFVALVVVPFLLLLATEAWSTFGGTDSNANENPESGAATDESAASDRGGGTAGDHPSREGRSGENAPDDDAIALTGTDLRISLALLTGTTIYAVWVVYNVQEAWSFAVAFASVVGLLAFGGMYYTADSGDDGNVIDASGPGGTQVTGNGSDTTAGDGRIVEGSLSAQPVTRPRVAVHSLDTLTSMAVADQQGIINDPGSGGCYLCRVNVVYEHYPGAPAVVSTPGDDTDGPVEVRGRTAAASSNGVDPENGDVRTADLGGRR